MMMWKLLSKRTALILLIMTVSVVGYKIIFADEKTPADICKVVADEKFQQKHGRVPSREDFLDENEIQNDWYPVFEKCLDDNT